MKKTIIAAALAAIVLTGCAEEAAADTSVFGSVEKKWDNGTEAISSEDTYVGFTFGEDLGNGMSAYGELSMDIAATATQRKAYVGLAGPIGSVAVGDQAGVQKQLGDATIDIFEGPGFDVNNSGDIDNSILATAKVGGITLSASNIPTSATDEAYELGASLNLGPINAHTAYAETAANVKNTLIGANISYSGVDLSGVFETEETAAGVETDTFTTVGSMDVGANTLKAGFQDVENTTETYTLEGVHNFSSRTSAYVNYQNAETEAGVESDTTTVGLRVKF